MTLRRRLILLHTAFAVFALGTAVASICVVNLHNSDATRQLEVLTSESLLAERLRGDLKALDVRLTRILLGKKQLDESFQAECNAIFTRLKEVSRYTTGGTTRRADLQTQIGQLSHSLETAIDICFQRIYAGDQTGAEKQHDRIAGKALWKDLDDCLLKLGSDLAAGRQSASASVLDEHSEMLVMALLIAVTGVGLVVTGALIVRRRLVSPIIALQTAAEAYADGNLKYRVSDAGTDELGDLGKTMNSMAGAIELSQQKYQSLFHNLRDTVIICRPDATIEECHDGDGNLLGEEAKSARGLKADHVWPNWSFPQGSWAQLIETVLSLQKPYHINDMQLAVSQTRSSIVDVVAYSVLYGGTQHVAITVRDVTDRHEMQHLLRRADTMEAALNLARGVAHDFKNLLQSVTVTLSLISKDTSEEFTAERTHTALEACRQAAALSKRLAHFAASDRGHPEDVGIAETIGTILSSLDEQFLNGIELRTDLPQNLNIQMDRDQWTQVVLNLIYNAREAMVDGGILAISAERIKAANPISPAFDSPYILLTVTDTGMGMTEQTIKHAFEPLYSTKQRNDYGPRGMGLTIVYAAVNMAGGFLKVSSEPNAGTTIRVFLPAKD